jgi:hypothetical protein
MLMALDFEPDRMSVAIENSALVLLSAATTMLGHWSILSAGRRGPANPGFSRCPLWLAEYGSRLIFPPGFAAWLLGSTLTAKSGVPSCRFPMSGFATAASSPARVGRHKKLTP